MTEQRDRPGVITLPPLIYAVFLAAGIYGRETLPYSAGPVSLRRSGGVLLIAAGLGLMVWALRTMVRARTTFNPFGSSSAIVSHGPFRFSRNPIYLADVLIYLGLAVWFDALLAVLLLPVVIAVVHFGVIVKEERYLERKFGDEYLRYKRRVRRWL